MALQALKNFLKMNRDDDSTAAKIERLAAAADAINRSGHVRRL